MIPNIGANLKLLVDSCPDIVVFITGSSAFDLKSKTGGPLTGRSTFFNLYPFAQMELNEDFLKVKGTLEQKLIFGLYPQVHMAENDNDRMDCLESIREGYLLKDLLLTEHMKGVLFVLNLLRLIAFQIGNEVSYSELGRALKADNKTIQRYLELLEKMYVIFSLNGFSRNLRKEYTKSPRYYFWDNGIRNALISNYNRPNQRDDIGKLWENYCISERMKRNHYLRDRASSFFWRTYDQKEIDYVEESGGRLFGYEIKWGKSRSSGEKLFSATYAKASVATINPENHLDFII